MKPNRTAWPPPADLPVGVILAGGQARRMGYVNKALVPFRGKPLIAHVLARTNQQVSGQLINSNASAQAFSILSTQDAWPIIKDPPDLPAYAGPLAGILAGMIVAKDAGFKNIASYPCDCPFLPRDLVARLMRARQAPQDIVLARSDGRTHPVVGLWPTRLADDLRTYLRAPESSKKILAWVDRHSYHEVDFSTCRGDPFENFNSPEDLAAKDHDD
ncbi:MAG: molybdenum cofactor guanylyltransferase MobA [Pseudomonadota bacterium]